MLKRIMILLMAATLAGGLFVADAQARGAPAESTWVAPALTTTSCEMTTASWPRREVPGCKRLSLGLRRGTIHRVGQ